MPKWGFAGPNPIKVYVLGFVLKSNLKEDDLRKLQSFRSRFRHDLPRMTEQKAFTFNMNSLAPQAQSLGDTLAGVTFDALNPDGTPSRALNAMNNQITFMATGYKRWKEHWPFAERILGTCLESLANDTLISGIFLHSQNKFTQNLATTEVDVSDLIVENCPLVASNLVSCRDLAHSYHGYQAKEDDAPGARVENTNVGIMLNSDQKLEVDVTFDIRFTPTKEFAQSNFRDGNALLGDLFTRLHMHNNRLFKNVIVPSIWQNIEGLSHS